MRVGVGHDVGSEPEVVACVERIGSLDALRDEWRELAATRGGIFATWEWADAWWRHFGADRELLLHACRDGEGRLIAVLPLYAWRRRWPRVIRFLGHGPGDELGPVHLPGAEATAAGGMGVALAGLSWSIVLAEQLPGGERWTELLGGSTWRRESSPVLTIPAGGWPAYLASRSANFRQQLRRRLRDMEASGRLAFRLADATSLQSDLDTLFSLHRERWAGRATDFADSPFHRELARIALDRGWLRLWILELDERPVAAWHGFHVDGVTNYYQAGRDPAHDRLSVGFVLLAHTIERAIAEGAREYRFGRGAEPFKFRFTDADSGLDTVALTRGTAGLPLRALRAARRGSRYFRPAR